MQIKKRLRLIILLSVPNFNKDNNDICKLIKMVSIG